MQRKNLGSDGSNGVPPLKEIQKNKLGGTAPFVADNGKY